MIRISNSTDKNIENFIKKEWPIANIEHFGSNVDFSKETFVFKASNGKNIVGAISCLYRAGVLEIKDLIVAKDMRGNGIGGLLMAKAEVFGQKLGAHKAHLTTGKDWDAAKFYEALGYKLIAILPKHHFKQDFAVYEKFL